MLIITHFNPHGTTYLNTEAVDYLYKKIDKGEVIHSSVDNSYECFVKSTSEAGVYDYGCKQLRDSYDHKAGYIWSSRCSVMNKLFGTTLIEVCINSASYGMDVYLLRDLAEEHTGKKFDVIEIVDSDEEVSYRLKEVN